MWESKIANDGSLLLYDGIVSIVGKLCVNCFKKFSWKKWDILWESNLSETNRTK